MSKGRGWEIVSPSHAKFAHTSKAKYRFADGVDDSNIVQRRRFVQGLSASLRGTTHQRRRKKPEEIFGEDRTVRRQSNRTDEREEWTSQDIKKPRRQSKRKKTTTDFANTAKQQSERLLKRLNGGRDEMKQLSGAEKLVHLRKLLELSVLPEQIPCRSEQSDRIKNVILQSIKEDTSGSLYISGQPGTGKTVTVHHVMHQLLEMREAGELPDFTYIEANAMQLPDATSLFSFLYATLKGENLAPLKAARALTQRFFNGTKRSPQYILVLVDELDSLMATRSRKVMHTLFEWASREHARLFVVGIANTMNLADRMSLKTASRFGVSKEVFPPYSSDDIMLIVKTRLGAYSELFSDQALKLVAIKTSNVTGDIRRALQVCRSCIDALAAGSDKISIKIMSDKIKMICQSPVALAIKSSSYFAKLFLIAVGKDMAANGVSETPFDNVLFRLSSALAQMEVDDPGVAIWESVCSDLESKGIIIAATPWKGRRERVLQVVGNPEDIEFHLNDDPVLESFP